MCLALDGNKQRSLYLYHLDARPNGSHHYRLVIAYDQYRRFPTVFIDPPNGLPDSCGLFQAAAELISYKTCFRGSYSFCNIGRGNKGHRSIKPCDHPAKAYAQVVERPLALVAAVASYEQPLLSRPMSQKEFEPLRHILQQIRSAPGHRRPDVSNSPRRETPKRNLYLQRQTETSAAMVARTVVYTCIAQLMFRMNRSSVVAHLKEASAVARIRFSVPSSNFASRRQPLSLRIQQ